jgi:hypothetical protein
LPPLDPPLLPPPLPPPPRLPPLLPPPVLPAVLPPLVSPPDVPSPAVGSPWVDEVVDAHPIATEIITRPRPTAVHRPIMFHLAPNVDRGEAPR